jgi:alpha-glucuronidase
VRTPSLPNRRLLSIAPLVVLFCALLGQPAYAEDGYRLWLRYDVVQDAALLAAYRQSASSIVVEGRSDTERVLREELERGPSALRRSRVSAGRRD